jgi:sugar/nucleoside kinase (ribokinase family)
MPDIRRWDLLAYGDPCMDLTLDLEGLPEPGGKVLARPALQSAGGTTANAACAVSRLGGRAAIFGRVGADAFGEALRGSMREDGVDIEHLQTVNGQSSGVAISLLPPGGDRALVVAPMAPPPPPFLTQRLHDAMLQSRLIYVMPYDQRELERIRHLAWRTGTRIAIDLEPSVASDRQAMEQRMALADLVFFNEAGFRAGTGEAPSVEALASLKAHLDPGPACIVVTMGAAGAMAVDQHGVIQQSAFATQVRDTTGAGDAFNAAFVLAYLEGNPLPACLRFACAVSSFVVTKLGARAGLPSRAAVNALLLND